MRQVAVLVIALLLGLACGSARLAPRYLSRCPAEGPETSADLGLLPVPVQLDDFYADVRSREREGAFEVVELGSVRDGAASYPMLTIRRRGAAGVRTMLIVAGIHGNEAAGLLAVPAILDVLEMGRAELDSWDVIVLAPANPVGIARGSRYNADGCDLNRDFRDPRTYEARVIRDFIRARSPDVIVALHEGPQDGYLLVVTSRGSEEQGETAVRAVRERGIALASRHFAGFSLGTPGLSAEGRGTDFLKWALRLHTLGSFASSLGIGTYTTETSWSSADFEERIRAHVLTVESLLMAGAPEAVE